MDMESAQIILNTGGVIYIKCHLFFFLLKGRCHEISDPLFCLTHSIWATNERDKTILRNISFLQRYSLVKFEIR